MNKYLRLLGFNFFIMFIFALMVFISSSSDFQIQRNDPFIVATFFVIGIMSVIGIVSDKNPYSINLMHWMFIFIFIFNAGILQYFKNDFPWGFVLEDDLLLKANLVIIAWCVVYYLVYNLGSKKSKTVEINDIHIKNKLFMVIFAIIISVIFVEIIGLGNLFSRDELGTELGDYSQSSILVLNTFIRAVPTVVLAYLIKERGLGIDKNTGYIVILFLVNLIVNFPTGAARYWSASIYLGLYLMLKPTKDDKFFFCIVFISAFLVGFPLLNEFRNYTFVEVMDRGISFSSFVDFFLAGDFDAYSMICRSIDLVSQVGSSHGSQLLGAMLFFIPRSIWPSKPIGSGAAIAVSQRQAFTNISCPIIAEGVVNFGIIGVFIFAVAVAKLIKYLDEIYWDNKRGSAINAITIVYPFYLGLFFFVFRGDLLSSMAYLVGFSVSAFIMQLVKGFKPRAGVKIPKFTLHQAKK